MPWWMWFVPCLWAGAFLTGAAALRRLSPDMVTFLRFAITAAGGAIVLRRPVARVFASRPTARQWSAILVLALIGGVGYHVTFYAGLARSQPPIASVVIATNPILTTLGAALFLRDRRPTRGLFVGLFLAFVGVVLLAMDKPAHDDATLSFIDRFTRGWGWGETLCLIASLSWATYALLMQRFRTTLLASLPGAGVTYFIYLFTALCTLPIVLATGSIAGIGTMTIGDWGCLVYLGLIATVIAYTLYNAALDRVGSARVSQVTYAVPALTTLLSLHFVPDFEPHWRTWAGLVTVTIGLVVSDGRVAARMRRVGAGMQRGGAEGAE